MEAVFPVTAVDVDALEAARAAATPGLWKLWGMDVMADQDGTSNFETAVRVAHTCYRDENGKPRTWDASLICQMQRALPDLLDEVRRGRALRERLEGLAEEMDAQPTKGNDGIVLGRFAVRLRDLLAAVDGGEQP